MVKYTCNGHLYILKFQFFFNSCILTYCSKTVLFQIPLMKNLRIIFSLLIAIIYNASFAQISIDYNPEQGPASFAVSQFRTVLLKEGQQLLTFREEDEVGKPSILLVDKQNIPSYLSSQLDASDFMEIQSQGFAHKWTDDSKTLLILYNDPIGAQYGLLDVSEYYQTHKTFKTLPEKLVNAGFEYRIVKFNLPWSSYRSSEAMDVHTHVCRDLRFWERFLDMMVENRLNVLSLWNNHPFPFMIRSTSFPKATPFDDEEMEQWQVFWKSLFRMAKDRGIQTFIVNWNIVVSPEFAEAYGADEYNDLSDQVKQYTKESVTQLINEYEDLTGIGVTLADWMGNFDEIEMTPQKREDWIEETFVAGMKEADRSVKFLHRSVLAGDPIAMRELLDRAELEDPALVEIKFNWSHGHSTPKLAITHDYHSGELDDRFWNPMPENYRIQWMVRNEDFFILRWGQPDFIREHIRLNNKEFVNGYFIGSEGYIPAVDYSHKPSAVKTWQYAFEKQWLFYKVWGRLLYQPGASDEIFSAAFDLRYGQGIGEGLLEAYKLASNMPLRLASFYRSTWDYTLYSEGFIEAEPSSRTEWFDRSSPFISIDQFINHETLDPDLLSIPKYVQGFLEEKTWPKNFISPLTLADSSENDSKKALNLIESLYPKVNSFSGALVSELDDVATWSHLGLYLADKLRAGVALQIFRETGDGTQKELAVHYLENCLEHWDQVISFTKDRYLPTPHVATQRYGDNFTQFSWAQLRPEVLRDIEIAQESKFETLTQQ